jgi:hypothetical protein
MSGKLRTLVWKTGVLTITQRPLTIWFIFHGLKGVKTSMGNVSLTSTNDCNKQPKPHLNNLLKCFSAVSPIRPFAASPLSGFQTETPAGD